MKNRHKYFLIVLGIFILGLIIFLVVNKKSNRGSDYKIGILADDGLALVSISKERKMINVLKINPEAKIWIPKGLSWYRNLTLNNILKQEKKTDLVDDIFFYNFGYKADKLLHLKKVDDWKNVYWWKLMLFNNFLTKEEVLKNDVNLSQDFLDEIMIRDFAETKIIEEDLKLSVINTSEVSGLANFMAKRFERLGFSVIFIGNNSDNKVKNCQILYGDEVIDTYSLFIINKIINCQMVKDEALNKNEIELYFDSSFSEMIEYSSYNNN